MEAIGEPCASPTSPQSLQERRSSSSAAEAAPLEGLKALEGLLSELFEARACRAYVSKCLILSTLACLCVNIFSNANLSDFCLIAEGSVLLRPPPGAADE